VRVATISKVPIFIVCLALLNFLAYFFVALYLDGDAVNGKIDDGHFYLGSHGRYTEVSVRIFAYSRWHTYSVWLTHSLAFVAVYFVVRRGKADPDA
jgi:hypothetical protein